MSGFFAKSIIALDNAGYDTSGYEDWLYSQMTEDNCFPADGCTTKDTGMAVLALNELCDSLVEKNGLMSRHSGVYIQITRGVHKRIHSFPTNIEPTVYAYSFELPSMTDNLENGIKVVTHDDIRWQRCDIKSVSLLPNTMLFNDAVEQGAGECVMVRDGWVTEATHSSVLGVKNGVVITRPLSNLILPGITRKVILEICSAKGIPVEERKYSLQELLEMDELMIAGTGSEITPVIQVDDHPIGKKKPGSITRLLQEIFFQKVQAE